MRPRSKARARYPDSARRGRTIAASYRRSTYHAFRRNAWTSVRGRPIASGRTGVDMYMNHASVIPAATTTTDRTISMNATEPPCGASWIGNTPARKRAKRVPASDGAPRATPVTRSEEHTSELQSRLHLVCRLLLEKKKIKD